MAFLFHLLDDTYRELHLFVIRRSQVVFIGNLFDQTSKPHVSGIAAVARTLFEDHVVRSRAFDYVFHGIAAVGALFVFFFTLIVEPRLVVLCLDFESVRYWYHIRGDTETIRFVQKFGLIACNEWNYKYTIGGCECQLDVCIQTMPLARNK